MTGTFGAKHSLPFASPDVASRFAAMPVPVRTHLLSIRAQVFDIAAKTPGVGQLRETLKWGQPAYLTPQTKSGSTIRFADTKSGGYALYAHCQTSLIRDFQVLFPGDFRYEGNRAIHFEADEEPPLDKLALLITNALTYHLKR